MSKRDQYVAQMKQQLDDLNEQIEELEKKSRKAEADVRVKYDEQVAELRKLSRAAQKKLEEIRKASDDKWEALVDEGDKVLKAFMHSFNYLKSQLK